VVVVPHGADAALDPALREDARDTLGVRGPLLLSVGSILNRRRLPELLRAVARLARRHPDATLDVVGENRSHPRLDLARLRDELGLTRHVRLSGFLSDGELQLRHAAADLAVYLSDYEGFGMTPLEALAHGVPPVVLDTPHSREVYGGGACYVTLDPVSIGAGLAHLLTDAAARQTLVAAGRAQLERYSWERTADILADALRRAASR
jgi:alpha-1,3-rhamnosyl/mannosyltransferase